MVDALTASPFRLARRRSAGVNTVTFFVKTRVLNLADATRGAVPCSRRAFRRGTAGVGAGWVLGDRLLGAASDSATTLPTRVLGRTGAEREAQLARGRDLARTLGPRYGPVT